ncbi:MAG: hypothetical protein RLZZ584_2866 [Pseudomonadota bacterium]
MNLIRRFLADVGPCLRHEGAWLGCNVSGRARHACIWLPRLVVCLVVALLALQVCPGVVQAAEPDSPALVFDVRGHTGPIRRLAVSADGTELVTASDDKTALIWNVSTQTVRRTLRVPLGAGELGRLYGVAISPDQRLVALAGNSVDARGVNRIHLFSLQSGAFVSAFDAHGGNIRRLLWSHDGQYLSAVYLDKPAFRLFRPDGRMMFESMLPADAYGLAMNGSGQMAVASFDGRVRIYGIQPDGVRQAGEIITTLPDPVSVSYSPDGRALAVGYYSRGKAGVLLVDVFSTDTLVLLRQFSFTDVRYGNLMTVAWQADGQAIYAGGTGYSEPGRFVVKRIMWPSGSIDAAVLAADSIQDFAALRDRRMVLAGFDASWAVIDSIKLVQQATSPVERIHAASTFRISRDGNVVEWRTTEGVTRAFHLPYRRLAPADAVPMMQAVNSRSGFQVTDWENHRSPRIDGRPVTLLPLEVSRAVAIHPDSGSVVMGTSRALRRIERGGQEIWSVQMNTEVRALNLTQDGRAIVGVLADGSVRWWRTKDGVNILSLLVLRDGRWICWTESGYFDAGPGAEDVIGWLVHRPGTVQVDYFGASRFRARYLRPDIIDRALAQLDESSAVQLANDARLQSAVDEAQAETLALLQALAPPKALVELLPPVITLTNAARIETTDDKVSIDFRMFDRNRQEADTIVARVDGRPVAVSIQKTAGASSGEAEGRMIVQLPKAEGTIQIFAQGPNGISMPAEVVFRSTAGRLRESGRRPSLYLLSIGVSRYANTKFNLGLAAKDARDFAAAMTGQQAKLYQRVETRILLDTQATRAAVLDGLKWLRSAALPGDVAILFVAGHGVSDAADTYYFLPHDMNVDKISMTGVSEHHFRSTLSAIPGRTLFFVDTCYAGKSVGRFSRREVNRLANGLASAELGVIVFSGSAPRQESLEDPVWGNGAFTKAVVEGLSGRADFRREGVVTHKGLDYYVADAVRNLTAGKQTPVTAVPSGVADFPIASIEVAEKIR